MLENDINRWYKQNLGKKKQAFMSYVLEVDSDTLFNILLDLKKNVRVDVDARLDTLQQIFAICKQKEDQLRAGLAQLKKSDEVEKPKGTPEE